MPKFIFRHSLLTILGFLFILSFSVVFILNFRPLYYHDMKTQNLSERYQMPEEEIRANYDTLITYNNLFHREELTFPSMPMSESGKIHFEEVKVIFDAIQLLLLATTISFWPLAIHTLRRKEVSFLKWIPILAGIVVTIILYWAIIDWEGLFITFHQIVFRNDYWLFDPYTDPIINFLPDIFFFHCLVGIILCMVLLLGGCLVGYQILKKKYNGGTYL